MEDLNNKIPPLEYSREEWDVILERDSLGQLPPPFRNVWVIYVDVDGFSKAVCDPARRVKVAHKYWDLAGSLLGGSGQHRQRYASNVVAGFEKADIQRDLEQKLVRWRRRVKVFSDSIFVFLDQSARSGGAPDDETLDGRFTTAVASRLSGMLWKDEFPHRGAIAFGNCLLDPDRGVFVGEAVVRAVKWAEKQSWFGISVEPEGMSLGQAASDFDVGFSLSDCEIPPAASSADKNGLLLEKTKPERTTITNSLGFDQTYEPLRGLVETGRRSKDLPDHIRHRYKQTARMWLENGFCKNDSPLWKELSALASEE